jgi:hypothetical protein
MKKRGVLYWIAMGYGILVTIFILAAFGPMIGELFIERGFSNFKEIAHSFFHWYDDPTAFFFVYIIGYIFIWWKPPVGSVIIVSGGLLFFIFNILNFMGLFIFVLPTMAVAILYFIDWMKRRKRSAGTV